MITPEQAVLLAILLCLAGALITLVISRSRTWAGWLAFAVTTTAALFVFFATQRVMLNGPFSDSAASGAIVSLGLILHFHVDGLAAFFLCLVAFIAVLASFYSIAYMRHYPDYSLARYYPNFLLFVAGMYGLLSTSDTMWIFCFFWQLMTLPSYTLIRFEYKKTENVRAAYKYLLMMEVACAAVMIGAGILAAPTQAGTLAKYDLETLSSNLPILLLLRPRATALAFTLFLTGFGIKAGMWPFGQLWLPDAHPAAPSPVSALLSGVMIKTGVFGLLRSFFWLIPAAVVPAFPLARWGFVVAVLGTITLFTGTMQALKQEHSKRLLAFHSIGQIGYILLGIGASMALLPNSHLAAATLATLALAGALFHVLNHGLFKGLLFLNAGSMLYATGTQDLNKLGGLMRLMPLTGITALIASFSISGVPLFNGFASKWTIYVATIQGSALAKYLPVCAAIAILTSALTLASFIKFFGVSFLSRSSSLVKEQATQRRHLEVSWLMQIPQALLAFCCVLLGVFPAIAFTLIRHTLQSSAEGLARIFASSSSDLNGSWVGLTAPHASAAFMPIVLAITASLIFVLTYGISKLGAAPRRASVPWLCGYAVEADCNRYVAHNFYFEIKRYFRWLGGTPRSIGKQPAVRKLT
jgi:hydrogenase-4 component B